LLIDTLVDCDSIGIKDTYDYIGSCVDIYNRYDSHMGNDTLLAVGSNGPFDTDGSIVSLIGYDTDETAGSNVYLDTYQGTCFVLR